MVLESGVCPLAPDPTPALLSSDLMMPQVKWWQNCPGRGAPPAARDCLVQSTDPWAASSPEPLSFLRGTRTAGSRGQRAAPSLWTPAILSLSGCGPKGWPLAFLRGNVLGLYSKKLERESCAGTPATLSGCSHRNSPSFPTPIQNLIEGEGRTFTPPFSAPAPRPQRASFLLW